MCGIVGFTNKNFSHEKSVSLIENMGNKILHRGPNDKDHWIDNQNILVMGHRRLSIFDLSKNGRQPMISPSRRYVISYNGEIYNFIDLRNELVRKGYKFESQSDTEVLLIGVEEWGLKETLRRVIGMFAFVLWDIKEQTLTLVRDRFGEKPLYYGFQKDTFMFASELKALKPHPDFEGVVDREALGYFMKYSYVPTPKSIYLGIKKLNPGCYVRIKYENNNWYLKEEIKYWNLYKENFPSQKINYYEVLEKTESLLIDSIKMQSSADVSVGSFLSGGIDSSLVSVLMQANSTSKINTYTIGFSEEDYDESKHASKIAKYIGTDHNEYIASHDDIMNVIPSLPLLYDEPFADSSQIPTYLVCNFASKDITVALSGDGGDEIFSGYNRYLWAPKFFNLINRYPSFLRKLFKSSTKRLRVNHIQKLYDVFKIILPKSFHVVAPAEKFEKILRIIDKEDEFEVYDTLRSIMHIDNPTLDFKDNLYSEKKEIFSNFGSNFLEKMMYTDIASYMLDDILVKVDRAAMANSLETRMPFLDYRIFEYTKKIPIDYLSNKSKSKKLLRDILKKYIPDSLVERPKAGFGIPIDTWLRKPLKDWVYDTLDLSIIHNQGYLDKSFISKLLNDHMSGKVNRHHEIWNILVWQNWIENE